MILLTLFFLFIVGVFILMVSRYDPQKQIPSSEEVPTEPSIAPDLKPPCVQSCSSSKSCSSKSCSSKSCSSKSCSSKSCSSSGSSSSSESSSSYPKSRYKPYIPRSDCEPFRKVRLKTNPYGTLLLDFHIRQYIRSPVLRYDIVQPYLDYCNKETVAGVKCNGKIYITKAYLVQHQDKFYIEIPVPHITGCAEIHFKFNFSTTDFPKTHLNYLYEQDDNPETNIMCRP